VVSLRKARKSSSIPLNVKLPPKKVREKSLILYELEGCQKAANYLTKYYGVRKMQIFLNSKKVKKDCVGTYFQNRAYFTKEGLDKRKVLHELYHHLIESNNFELPLKTEEKKANNFAKQFLRS
jgi:hypothetical protein